MSKIITVKGSLFDAPTDSIICHACNCEGVWGAGIAAQFARKFLDAYNEYRTVCCTPTPLLLEKCLILETAPYQIGCLFTSSGYGNNVDSKISILKNTWYAVQDLLIKNTSNKPIHMCKINSGLFGVPWEETLKVLESFDHEFTIWDF